jgi:hypothetical protein
VTPLPGPRRFARLLTCKEASRLISQQLDTPLPLRERLLLRFHLFWCDACTRFVQQAAYLRRAMRRYRM